MPYNKQFRKLAIAEDLCRSLDRRKADEGRRGSLTVYVEEILAAYLKGIFGRYVSDQGTEGPLITAAKIEQRKITSHERTKATGS